MTSSARSTQDSIITRREVRADDVAAVSAIARSTDFFSDEEVDVAVELIEDRLENGETSDYQFILAEWSGKTVGFASFGVIPCTLGSFDLYWIAVDRRAQNLGIGRKLLLASEEAIVAMGGRRVYVETSSRAQYEPTRLFYERCGYTVDAVQHDFYAPGDGKVTLLKILKK